MAGSKEKPYLIGIDLGGTKILTVAADQKGKILLRKKEETRAREGPQVVIGQIADSVEEVLQLARINKEEVLAAGICAAGFYNFQKGLIMESPNLAKWKGVPLGKLLKEKINLPLFVENDANAAAYGEYLRGAGQGKNHLIYITVSTGIGGGIISHGEIYRGAEGYAGEIGHITMELEGPTCKCGNRGCLETLASGTAIARQAREALALGMPTRMPQVAAMENREEVTARHVFTAAEMGDQVAQEIVNRSIEYLGAGLGTLAHLFNPEAFVIGGGVSLSGDSLFTPLREVFYRRAPGPVSEKVEILPARLREEAGIQGILLLAAQAYTHP
ncbi:MAG: ROK family protein [Candidatus Syntrophonatronum acetioxidans]|uniref:Glucokinase n=1 Tax=Candidatus Syntrophonatronum acetioxidans TaxID=1795816 RepID=A0A424YEV3_9FIRM|nr:MAG: ROK family protein [Candidatus Syntrophonatronum acetioxidans]